MDSNNKNLENQKIILSLVFLKPNNESNEFGKWILNIGRKYVIGRKEGDININHPLLSKKHLEITFYTFEQIIMKDLGSKNGTYINNAKVNPGVEIKFTSKDKISVGDINNKFFFNEYQDVQKKTVFGNTKETNDPNNSEVTQKIHNNNFGNNNYNRRFRYNFFINRNRQMNRNRYNNRFNRYNRYNRYNNRFNRYNKFNQKDVHSEHHINSKSEDKDKKAPLSADNYKSDENGDNKNKSYDEYLIKEIAKSKNKFIGKKVERNKSKDKDDKQKRKELVKLIKTKKIGLEKLKRKLNSIKSDSDEDYELDEEGEELEEDDMIDFDNKKGKLVLKSKKLQDFELVVDVNDKNVSKLQNVKQIKYLVNGYLVFNVKSKKLIYDE